MVKRVLFLAVTVGAFFGGRAIYLKATDGWPDVLAASDALHGSAAFGRLQQARVGDQPADVSLEQAALTENVAVF